MVLLCINFFLCCPSPSACIMNNRSACMIAHSAFRYFYAVDFVCFGANDPVSFHFFSVLKPLRLGRGVRGLVYFERYSTTLLANDIASYFLAKFVLFILFPSIIGMKNVFVPFDFLVIVISMTCN